MTPDAYTHMKNNLSFAEYCLRSLMKAKGLPEPVAADIRRAIGGIVGAKYRLMLDARGDSQK